MTRGSDRRSSLVALAAVLAAACDPARSDEQGQRTASQPAPQSPIVGPFANDPVAPAPIVAALPTTASNAPLLRGSDNSNAANNGSNSGLTDPSNPAPLAATPTEPALPIANPVLDNSASNDALLDGLRGVWSDGPTRTQRDGNGWVLSECVLTIRGPTDAREECTTTTRYGDNELDRCNQTGQTRRWITASPYTLSVSDGYVTFTPGEVELVRDDEGRCQYRAAGQHTTMTTQGWTGRGDVLSVRNTRSDGTDQGTSSYRRRSSVAPRR
jgi:hypothetical protein